MKLLLTIALLAAIYMSFYMVNMMINKDVSITNKNFGFSSSGQDIRGLNQFGEYQVISGQPLFDPDREPVKIVVEKNIVKQKAVAKQLKVQALGIAVTGEKLLAVVKDLRTGKIFRLRVNDKIEGWALTSVSADSFVFAKGEIEKVVSFKSGGG